MADSEWGDDSSSSNQRGRGGGRGRGRGRGGYNRNNDFEDNDNNGVGGWGDDGDNEGRSSRGRGGRGGGRGRGGGGRFSDKNDEDNGGNDFGDDQPPVNDKPRPTYIPPEIDENDCNGIEAGINFNKYANFAVKVSGDSVPAHVESFKASGLREVLLEKLAKCNYTIPTPIQKYSIPIIIGGRDIMASAQTGSGKTVSFFIFEYNLKLIKIIENVCTTD